MIEDDEIRARAYLIWEREGKPRGREKENWDMAREEIAIERNQRLATLPNPIAQGKFYADPADEAEPITAAEESFGDVPGAPGQDQGETVPYPFTPDAVPESADIEPPAKRRRTTSRKRRTDP